MPIKCISTKPVEICNECSFMDENYHCLYQICPISSPEVCPDCGYLRPGDNKGKGRCRWKPDFKRPLPILPEKVRFGTALEEALTPGEMT